MKKQHRFRSIIMTTVITMLMLTQPLGATTQDERRASLNLQDVDISLLISNISKLTGRSFIVDPSVKGKVSIVSATPLTKKEIYQVFLSTIRSYGYVATEGRLATRIAPSKKGKADASYSDNINNDEFVTHAIKLNNTSVDKVVPVIKPLIDSDGHVAAHPESGIIVLSSYGSNIDSVLAVIRKIEKSANRDIHIVKINHSTATDIHKLLEEAEVTKGKGSARVADKTRVTIDHRTNSLIVSADKESAKEIIEMISKLDTPSNDAELTKVYYLKYAKASEVEEVLNGVAKRGSGAASNSVSAAKKPSIQIVESSNAIIVDADHAGLKKLDALIAQLDIKRSQVMVKAVIAEISIDKAAELGVNWAYDGSQNGDSPVGIVDFNDSLSGLATAVESGVVPQGLNGLNLAIGTTTSSGLRYGLLLKALKGDTNSNILSTPSIVTLDNEEAEIVVGQSVPFITGSYTSTGTDSTPTNPFQTIQRDDVGLSLKIKPRINDGKTIRLEVTQEVSSIAPSSISAADVITNKRSLKTTVNIDDGQILALGGLLDESNQENSQKVPLLGDLPILGHLFSYNKNTKLKRNLTVFIHPTILRNASDGDVSTRERYDMLRDDRQLSDNTFALKWMYGMDVEFRGIDDFLSKSKLYEASNESFTNIEVIEKNNAEHSFEVSQ